MPKQPPHDDHEVMINKYSGDLGNISGSCPTSDLGYDEVLVDFHETSYRRSKHAKGLPLGIFGLNVRRVRKQKNLSLRDLALQIGTGPSELQQLERGLLVPIDRALVIYLIRALGIEIVLDQKPKPGPKTYKLRHCIKSPPKVSSAILQHSVTMAKLLSQWPEALFTAHPLAQAAREAAEAVLLEI